MEGNFGLNLKAVLQHIENAETFSIFFPRLRRALVVDMRHGPDDGPLVRVLPMSRSTADRLRTIKRMRPYLPRPQEIVAIPWDAYVKSLITSGVWEKVKARVDSAGSAESVRVLQTAFDELCNADSRELAALIRGDQYETLWTRHSRQP